MNSLEAIVDQSKTNPSEEVLQEQEISKASPVCQQLYSLLPKDLAVRYQVVPLEAKERLLILGSAIPLTPAIIEELHFATDYRIDYTLLPQEEITKRLADNALHLPQKNTTLPVTLFPPRRNEDMFLNTTTDSEESPVVHHVALLLEEAIQEKASDLHLETFETGCRVRYRIDGALQEKGTLPLPLAAAMISRLKLLAQLDITERRLPQDGRLHHTWNDTTVDFRLSSLPTQFGESIVLRLLNRCHLVRDLKALSLPATLHRSLHQLLKQPHGLLIVTGPTGAGKTTTLYACLQELQERDLKILTVEDPVEYELEGMVQVPIQDAIGRTFQRVLRSSLRHDPDVIMIGETRDAETALMAMKASLTGHLVLTTLHTNDAIGAISRLIDMGVDPMMILTTLQGVLAQRLVRKICPLCRTASLRKHFPVSVQTFFRDTPLPEQLYYGSGCTACKGTGYQGRIGLFELLLLDDDLRLLIHEKAPDHQLRAHTMKNGMRTLHAAALQFVLEGVTTVEEVISSVPTSIFA